MPERPAAALEPVAATVPSVLEALRAGFAEAARGDPREHDLLVAGRRLRLRFAGPELEALLLPALAHIAAPAAGEPHGVLEAWDCASAGVERPALPWSERDIAALGEVLPLSSDGYGVLHDPVFDGVTVADRRAGVLVYNAADAATLPWYERAAPLRAGLHWLLAGPGRHLVHAGVVCPDEDAGALLAGPGGSGKSTLAVAAAEAGHGYVGDDYVLFDGGRAHSLYCTAKLTPDSLRLLGGGLVTSTAPAPGEEGKAVVDMRASAGISLRAAARVGAVVLPRLGGSPEPVLRPVGAAEALRALAPSTILQLPTRNGDALALTAALLRSVPAFTLDPGPDPRAAVPALAAALR